MTPPMFDILNIQTWKVMMSLYLKGLEIHIYLTTIKDSYFNNSKYIEANSKAIYALKSTLNDEYLSRDLTLIRLLLYGTLLSPLANKSNIMWGATRMLEVRLPTYATWSKGISPLR